MHYCLDAKQHTHPASPARSVRSGRPIAGFWASCTDCGSFSHCSAGEQAAIISGGWVIGRVCDDTHYTPAKDRRFFYLSATEYAAGLKFLSGFKPTKYNLHYYNCVDYLRDAAAHFGITVPDFLLIDEPEELADWL